MRLIFIELEGYKRFRRQARLDVNGPLIALVGANNAGKSTVLRAISRLEDTEAIGREQTRRHEFDPQLEAVRARFLLDDADIDAAGELLDGQPRPRWFTVGKRMDGERTLSVVPRPTRDLSERHDAGRQLEGALDDGGLTRADGTVIVGPEAFPPILKALASADEKLDDQVRASLDAVISHLRERERDAGDKTLAARLEDLLAEERQPVLAMRVAQAMYNRSPDFVYFDAAERELDGEYDLNELAENPPPALANFATLAELDLVALRDAKSTRDHGLVKEILERANERLADAFAGWTQFPTTVSVESGDGGLIELLVAEDSGGYSPFDDQSDGLKTFVALAARVMNSERRTPPVVLIDELESHLHYDAEADLLLMFARERRVDRVIYSTHSIGCLPPDLGTGVRVVRRIPDSTESEIDNHLWRAKVGIQPLLYALGAAQLSFIPLRDALITEGQSELIVLPTLLCEAMGIDVLPFQVVPGAAQARPAQVAGLDLEAPRVVWLLDRDKGGRDHARKVRRQVSPTRVLMLSADEDDAVVLEDLVDPEVYARAVNDVIRRYHDQEMPTSALADTMRPTSVEAWCAEQRIEPPAKIAVCHHIVEQRAERQLLAEPRRDFVAALYGRITAALDEIPKQSG